MDHSSVIINIDTLTLQAQPVSPPVAPVAAILARASVVVSHVTDVPGLLTRGSATQVRVAAHGVTSNWPPTH